MSEALPKITLITAVRNGAATMERALKSVEAQAYPNLEYFMMDAASTDGTVEIIERYRHLLHYFHSRSDNGPYDVYRQAFGMLSGEIVGFLSCDDWLEPGALHIIAAMHREAPETKIYGHAMQEHRLQPDGSIVENRLFQLPEGERFTLIDGLYCQGLTQFYHRDVIREHGEFAERRYKQLADRDFYIRLGLADLPKKVVDKTLYHFLVHPNSNSTSGAVPKTIEMLGETYRMAEDYATRNDFTPEQHSLFRDWLCFNAIRLAFFYFKAKNYPAGIRLLTHAFRQFPLSFLKNIINSKMPAPYRPISS